MDALSKHIKKEIIRGLKSGENKHDLFTRLRTEENDRPLRWFLSKFPDSVPKPIFKVLNTITYIIWAIFALGAFLSLFETLNAQSILSFFITIFITVELIKFTGYIYLPGIIYFIWALIEWFFEMSRMMQTNYFEEEGSTELAYTSFILLVVAIILMAIIRKNVFPHYNWFRPYKDQNGDYIFARPKNT